jgi:amino acid transporter
LFTVQFTASQAGISMPAAYVGAFLIAIPIALVLCQLARRLPSAGGWYTYVSRGVHPRAGFLVAWLYFLYAPLQTAITGTSIGVAFSGTIQSEYGVNIPWWVFMLVIIVFVVAMAYRGISFSTRAIVILGLAELAIGVGCLRDRSDLGGRRRTNRDITQAAPAGGRSGRRRLCR